MIKLFFFTYVYRQSGFSKALLPVVISLIFGGILVVTRCLPSLIAPPLEAFPDTHESVYGTKSYMNEPANFRFGHNPLSRSKNIKVNP